MLLNKTLWRWVGMKSDGQGWCGWNGQGVRVAIAWVGRGYI